MAVALQQRKDSNTPYLDALTEQEQLFVLTLYVTDSQRRAAATANYSPKGASHIAARPSIKRALQEQHEVSQVHPDPTRSQITGKLWYEATLMTNSGQARISALKTLADIKGMTGGGGDSGDSAIGEFMAGIKAATVAGVFEGVKAGVQKGVEDAGAREGGVSQVLKVDAKVVEDVDLGRALGQGAKEVE